MKYPKSALALTAIVVLWIIIIRLPATEIGGTSTPRYEYATVRWAGKDNTHIIRPGGQVEFVGAELRKATKPDRADDRSFYLNLVMNGLSKEGYEFSGMTNDEIVMRRAVTK